MHEDLTGTLFTTFKIMVSSSESWQRINLLYCEPNRKARGLFTAYPVKGIGVSFENMNALLESDVMIVAVLHRAPNITPYDQKETHHSLKSLIENEPRTDFA